jgi:hypothetical protein
MCSNYKTLFNTTNLVIPNLNLLMLETKNKKALHTAPVKQEVLQHLTDIILV